MAENPYKPHHCPFEALNQTWTGDRNFQKLEEDAKVHRAKSTFLLKMINKSKVGCWQERTCHVVLLP